MRFSCFCLEAVDARQQAVDRVVEVERRLGDEIVEGRQRVLIASRHCAITVVGMLHIKVLELAVVGWWHIEPISPFERLM